MAVDGRTETPTGSAEPADETSVDGPEPDAVAVSESGDGVSEPLDAESEPVEAVSESVDAEPADRSADPEQDSSEPIDARPADAHPVAVPAVAVRTPRRTPRRTYVRRGLAATAVALVLALSVSAFAMVGPTTANVDQRFVDTARTQGHVVASGDQETLLVSAAHKICDRREDHSTVALRRSTALSPEELGAIQQAFTTDVRGFTALALDTYCPN